MKSSIDRLDLPAPSSLAAERAPWSAGHDRLLVPVPPLGGVLEEGPVHVDQGAVRHALRSTLPPPRRARCHELDMSQALARALHAAGVSQAFGLTGGAIAPFARALNESPIGFVHCRHETGAAFAALEGYFATGRPGLVFTTSGPGVTNALTGLVAARWEGGKLVLVSAASPACNRGRWGFQETGAWGLGPAGAHPGPPLHYSTLIDDPACWPVVQNRLLRGLARPGPFVAHVQLPLSIQSAPAPGGCDVGVPNVGARIACSAASLEQVVEKLTGSAFVLWVGFGARDSAALVRAFAEQTGAPVMCTPRAKGIFPEDHPLYLGVAGFGGHASVDEYLTRSRPDHVVVLGSRLGEMTSLWNERLTGHRGLVHVDVDPDVFGAAFPGVPTFEVQSDIGELLAALLLRCGSTLRSRAPRPEARPFPAAPPARRRGRVRPAVLMDALQRHVVDGSDAVVMSEAGNSFAWATHWLRFSQRSTYRASFGFGSMGHAATGVLGAALASRRKAVAVLGDGAMLMNSEVSTAVEHQAPAVWVVLNDGEYGMIRQGMKSIGYAPFGTRIPASDFARMAEAVGARGLKVRSEAKLDAALAAAMAETGPVVVDVDVDPAEEAPARKRNASLLGQGVGGAGWTGREP